MLLKPLLDINYRVSCSSGDANHNVLKLRLFCFWVITFILYKIKEDCFLTNSSGFDRIT